MVMVMVFIMVVAAATMAVMVVFLFHLGQVGRHLGFSLHSLHQLRAGKLIPGSGNDSRFRVMLTEQLDGSIQFLLGNTVCTGQDNGSCGFNLVVVKLTKVLHVNLHLACVNHGNGAIQHHVFICDLFNSGKHVRQLTYTGGFNHDPVGGIVINHLLQRLAKVTYQTAADTAGIHLCDIHTCVLEETSVDTDFTKLVFDQYNFLTCIALRNHFFDKGCLTGS